MALSSSTDLEALFSSYQREEIFGKALDQTLNSDQVKNSQKKLIGLPDPPDLRAIAKENAQDAWKRVSGDVEKHLQLLQAQRNREEVLRQSAGPAPVDPELEEAYQDVSDQYDRLSQHVTDLENKRRKLDTLREEARNARTVIDVKLQLAEAAEKIFYEEVALAGKQQQSGTNGPPNNSLDVSRAKLATAKANLTATQARLSKRLEDIDEARQKVAADHEKASRAASQVETARMRLRLQREASQNRHLSNYFQIDPELSELAVSIRKSEDSLQSSLAQRGIQPMLIQGINKALGRIYATNVSLRGVVIPDDFVDTGNRHPTEVWGRVERLIGSAPSLSIGLSGPRGAGKTTLIDWICAGRGILDRPSGLGIAVAAPSDYAPREFLLYLYSELCKAVLRFTGRLSPDADIIERKHRWQQHLTYAIAATALLTLGTAAYLAVQELSPASLSPRSSAATGLVIAVVVAIFSYAWFDARRTCRRLITNVGAADLALNVRNKVDARERRRTEEGPPDIVSQDRPRRPRRQRRRRRWLPLRRSVRQPPGLPPEYQVPKRRRVASVGQQLWRTRLPMPVQVLLAIVGLGVIIAIQPGLGGRHGRELLIVCILTLGLLAANYATHGFARSFIASTVSSSPERISDGDPGAIQSNTSVFSVLARVTSAICLQKAVGLLTFVGALLIIGSTLPVNPHLAWGVPIAVAVAGFAAMLGYIYLFELRIHVSAVNIDPMPEPDVTLLQMSKLAKEGLDLVEYQLSYTRGWSAGITASLPVAIAAQRTGGQTSQRLEVTLPELVARFRDLAGRLAAHRYPLIFGVDELDKIEKAENARSFLNSLKGVFGVPKCYYLVSMSDDAFADFERRGIPFRSAFDSAFDDVIYVGYVNFEIAQAILDDNIVGLSIPFQGLCFCLAGGLPRELIRYTRELRDLAGSQTYLDVAAEQLLHAEVLSQVDAALIGLRGSAEDDSQQSTLIICRTLRATPMQEADLFAFCQQFVGQQSRSERQPIPRKNPADGGPTQIGRELVAFAYFAATVLGFFRRDLSRKDMEAAERHGSSSFDQLAAARKAFSSGPAAVWHEINVFRKARGTETLPYPFWHADAG